MPEPLQEAHAAFMQTGVSIVVASRSADKVPSLSRACGCRVSDDRRRVTVLLRPSRARDLMADLRSSGQVAVVFCEPSTHRTIQVKGRDPVLEAPLAGDAERARRLMEEFADVLEPFAYTREMVRAMLSSAPDDMTALSFTPLDVFSQTPGPRAGERMK